MTSTPNVPFTQPLALRLPQAAEARDLADAAIAREFTRAVVWIDAHVTPRIVRDPAAFTVNVSLEHCEGALRSAVLHTLEVSGYVVELERNVNTLGADRLTISWRPA